MKCKQCGDCCKKFCITLGEDDFREWEEEERHDIIDSAWMIFDWTIEGERHRGADGFCREGGEEPTPDGDKACLYLMYQPHLKKHICRIHDVKPAICRGYTCVKESLK